MANKSSKLTLVIAGDNKGAVKAVEGVGGAVGVLQGKLGGLGAGIAGAFSIAAVEKFTGAVTDGYTAAAASVAVIKRVTGESAEDASLLAFGAQQAGVEATKASAAYGILATNIDKGKVAAEGIATKDGNGNLLSFGQILDNIADHLHALPPGFERTAEARKLFGRGGADLVKILGDGSAALEAQRQKMQELGLEFNEEGLKKYQEYVHAQRDVQAAVSGLEVTLAQKVTPALEAVDHVVVSGAKAFQSLPGPVQATAEAGAALLAVVGPLALGIGLLGPSLKAGLTFLHLWPEAAAETAASTEAATVATGELTAAQLAESRAALEAAGAEAELVAALQLVGATEEEVAIATGARAAAADASTASTTEAAAAGGLLSSAAVVALPAVVGLGGALWAFSKDAENARNRSHELTAEVSDLSSTAQSSGKSIKDTFVATTLYEFATKNKDALDALGISASDLEKAVTGSHAGWQQFVDDNLRSRKALGENAYASDQLTSHAKGPVGSILDLRSALTQARVATRDQSAETKRLGDNLDEAGPKAKGLAEDLRSIGDAASDQAQKTFDARQALAESTDTVVSSKDELAKAEQAATGNSDEYRSAVKQESDDLAQLRDDEVAVTDAKVKATEAQGDLNDARKEAKKRLDDLRQSVIDTADAERDAVTASKRAAQELERKNADPRASALDREEAQNAAIDAQHKAAEAATEHAKAIADNSTAQAAGVEGDKGVVDAKKKIADADDAIRQAEQKVKDQRAVVTADGVAKSKVIEQAVKDVKSAQDKVNEALLDQAGKYRDVAVAQLGPVAGLQAYNGELKKLYDSLDPNSDLAARVAALLASIKTAISLDLGQIPDSVARGGAPAPGTPGSAIPPTRSNLKSAKAAPSAPVSVTIINQGTSVQNRRKNEQATKKSLDKFARSQR